MSGFSLLWIAACALVALAATFAASRVRTALSSRVAHEQRRAEQTAEVQLATLEALAAAVDARERPPRDGKRVQHYATALAVAMGMKEAEVEAVRAAALLRDVGKLAVPEYILAKPGPLTPEEVEKVRHHARAGADIIALVPFPYPVAPLILSHHERWDGRGYPAGLRGSDIPAGARVLSVADWYDAVVSERPYHQAIPPDSAAVLLQQEAGRALDPEMVETFLRILPALHQSAPAGSSGAAAAPRRPAPPRAAHTARSSVLDEISLAHHEIEALYQVSRAMGTSLGVFDTMSLLAAKLHDLVPFSSCALFLLTESSGTLHCGFATGVESEALRRMTFTKGDGLTGWVAQHRTPLLGAAPGDDFGATGWAGTTALQSAFVNPLVLGERLIGTLNLYHTEPDTYTRDHRRLMEGVCDQAAAVIHNAVIFDATKEASLTDPLTGLSNRRFMHGYVAAELARAERVGGEFSIIVLDLDYFKQINDAHGHEAGDRALRQVADALKREVRPYDVCARFAGDEFVVIVTGCGPAEAEQKRLDLQHAIRNVVFQAGSGERLSLSVSAGAASFPADGHDYDALLATADRRMYLDKGRGRGHEGALPDLPAAGPGLRSTLRLVGDPLPHAHLRASGAPRAHRSLPDAPRQ